MFGGLIEQQGTVVSAQADPRGGMRLRVEAPAVAREAAPKDSVAVDGVCLTVVAGDESSITFDVVPETLARSTLGNLREGDRLNLELSLRLGDRIGGHFIYGHIDSTAQIESKVAEGQGHRLRLRAPRELARFIVEKGYVALDGVSLTIASAGGGSFEIALIPETSASTTLGVKSAGDRVNLEIDPIARYAIGAVDAYDRSASVL